jgi:hemolysin activation/secretion protein
MGRTSRLLAGSTLHIWGTRILRAIHLGLPRALTFLLVASVAAGYGVAAQAQITPRELPNTVQPGRDQPPPLPIAPESDFDFSIQAPKRTPVPRAADELTFTLRDITITGTTVFSAASLRPLYEALIGREVKLADIIAVADAIEAKYREAGYILTRAFVPPQRVGNGIFTLSVVEGFVKALDVEGGNEAAQNQVKAYLQPVLTARPLDIHTMERALLLANDTPGITASGLLRPSPDTPGASDLVVTLTQSTMSGGFAIDNRGSKFAGPWTVRGDAAANGLITGNDQLMASLSSTIPSTIEKRTALLRYSHPLGSDGTILSLVASGTRGVPGSILAPSNVITKSYAVGPRLRIPLLRSRAESLFIETGLNWQYAEVNTIAGLLSHDQWRTADASLTYIENGFLNGTSSLTFGIEQGLPILGASPNGSADLSRPGADTDFTKLTASLRRGQILSGPLNLALSASGQYSFAPLISGEQAAFGGDSIGRGYDPSVLQGDHGIGGSVELRYDLRFVDSVILSAQPYVFYDRARVWNRTGGVTGGATLSSTGFGVRAQLPHEISAGLEFAQTLSSLAANDDGRLTSRVLFNAGIRF